MNTKAIRVLNCSGGGAKGYLTVRILRLIIQMIGISEREFFSLFQAMSGASIGGILVLAFSYGVSLEEIEELFTQYGKKIFSTDQNDNTRPSALGYAGATIGNSFYGSPDDYDSLTDLAIVDGVMTGEKYGHRVMIDLLNAKFGNDTLASLNNKIAIPSFRTDNTQAIMFSNFVNETYFVGHDYRIVDVALATSAAPFYLPQHRFGGHTHWDGGVWCNTPTEMAILVAKLVKPIHDSIIAWSFGTGENYFSFASTDNVSIGNSFFGQVGSLAQAMMIGGNQYTDYKLALQNDTMLTSMYSDNYFSRFNPNPFFDKKIDDFSLDTLAVARATAQQYCATNASEIAAAFGHLVA